MIKKKVLVLAYMVSPYRGSEYSVAWNFLTYMSKYCELTVLFGASGSHMGDVDDLQHYLTKNTVPGVNFIPVIPSQFANRLNLLNRNGWLPYTFYMAYRMWHRGVYKIASELVKKQEFDLIHYLGPIGYREPGYLWKLGLPYVWGPIGGANNVPRCLIPALPTMDKIKLTFRAVANWLQLRFSFNLRQALSHSDVLLTATSENQQIFLKIHDKESYYIPENGIVGSISLDRIKFQDLQAIHLIWIGSIEARKALKILVEALAKCPEARKFVVHVAGDGPLRPSMELKVRDAGLESIFVWHGQIPRDKLKELISKCHLHIVTSVSEGNPTTIWEAMENGVPTLTIDHCGMHDTITQNFGIKLPLADYSQVVNSLSQRLEELAKQPMQLSEMAERVVGEAPKYHWDLRPDFFLDRYDEAIQNSRKRFNAK